jgi:Flp pilus assembly protein TadG
MIFHAWDRGTRAVAAVEFALVSPFLFMVLAAAVDFGLFNYGLTRLNLAVAAGAEYAQILGTTATKTGVQNYVVSVTNLSNVTSTATAPACYCMTGSTNARALTATTCAAVCPDGVATSTYFMTIGASYTYTPIMPLWDYMATSTATVTTAVQLQ